MMSKSTGTHNYSSRGGQLDMAIIGPKLVWWGTIALLGFTVFYPSVLLLINSFQTGQGSFSLEMYKTLFRDPEILASMFNSLKVVVPATLIGTLLGVVLAYIVARTDVPGKGIWQTLIVTPYLIPPFVGAISWTYLLGPVGLVNNLYMDWFGASDPLINIYSIGGMILVMSLYGYAIPYIVVLPALRKIDAAVEEAGRISGASSRRILKDITLPLIFPSIMGGFLLLFMNLLADFGIPAVLGTREQINLMTTQIYKTILSVDMPNNLQIAAANSILLALFGIVGLLLYDRTIKSSKYVVVSGKGAAGENTKLGKWKVPVLIFLAVVFLVTAVAPIGAAAYTSLIKAVGAPTSWENITLKNYSTLFQIESIKRSLLNSFSLAAISGFVIASLSLILSYMIIRGRMFGSKLVQTLVAIPYAVPGTIVALSMILAFAKPLPVVGWQLYSTYWILLIAYLARFMNLGMQTISGAITQIHPSLEEASRISGASQMTTFRKILLPLLRPSFYAAFFLVMMPALGEITLSSLLWSVGNETIGVIVFSSQEEGKIVITAAFAMVLIAFVIGINMLARIFSKGKVGI